MLLYLVRHGEAMTEYEDPSRPLTPAGADDVKRVAELIRLSARPYVIYHSTKRRAEQTAQIMATYMNPSGGITETEGLKPGDEPIIWADKIMSEDRDIMLVGHLPHMALLSSLLVSGSAGMSAFSFEPSAVLCLESKDELWWVRWMVCPSMLGSE